MTTEEKPIIDNYVMSFKKRKALESCVSAQSICWNVDNIEYKSKVSALIKQLLDLRNSNNLTDEEFSEVASWALSLYIEREVSARVATELNKRLLEVPLYKGRLRFGDRERR